MYNNLLTIVSFNVYFLIVYDEMCCTQHLEIGTKPVSLIHPKKVLVPCNNHSLSKTKSKKQIVLPPRLPHMNNRNHYPQQVSDDQGSSDRSEFAFSSGASLPVSSASRLVFSEHEHTSHRLNGYGENRLNTNVSQTEQSRQGNISHSSTARNAVTNRPVNTTPPRHPDYADVSERLRSYARWTHRRPDPTALANAGFFFTSKLDCMIQCR